MNEDLKKHVVTLLEKKLDSGSLFGLIDRDDVGFEPYFKSVKELYSFVNAEKNGKRPFSKFAVIDLDKVEGWRNSNENLLWKYLPLIKYER